MKLTGCIVRRCELPVEFVERYGAVFLPFVILIIFVVPLFLPFVGLRLFSVHCICYRFVGMLSEK